jgi:CelD/BcsL family acetyltransferase involved in cellulose biosynthesis
VRVFGLSVAGEWIATAYGLVHAKTFHLLIVSMAGGGWEASAPGIAIIAQFVRWSRQQGLTMMDFSLGEMDYKTGFGGQPHDLYALSLPLTSRGRVAAAMRHAAARTKERLMARPRLFAFLRPAVRLCRRMTSPFR